MSEWLFCVPKLTLQPQGLHRGARPDASEGCQDWTHFVLQVWRHVRANAQVDERPRRNVAPHRVV